MRGTEVATHGHGTLRRRLHFKAIAEPRVVIKEEFVDCIFLSKFDIHFGEYKHYSAFSVIVC